MYYQKIRDYLPQGFSIIAPLVIILSILYLSYLISYMFFHIIVELFSIFIAVLMFMIAWNTRHFKDDHFFLYLGIASFFVGCLDFLHTLTYPGMDVLIVTQTIISSTNVTASIWIAARYLQSISLLIIIIVMDKKVSRPELVYRVVLFIYFFMTTFSLTLIFSGLFPTCFIEGVGLTPFKIISEYFIIVLLLLSALTITIKRKSFSQRVSHLLVIAIGAMILSEFSFTLYGIDVYGFFNVLGHILKVVFFYFLYQAVVVTSLDESVNIIFRNLSQSTLALKKSEERFRALFNQSPISIWEEDYSKVSKYFNKLRKSGITDLQAYLDSHPEEIQKIFELIEVIDINNSTLELYQAKSKNEFLGGLSKFVDQVNLSVMRNELVAYFEGERFFEGRVQAKKMSGENFPALIRTASTSSTDTNLERVIVSVFDMSLIVQAEEERAEMEKRRTNFIRMTSHELRTPLTTISGFFELLKRNKETIDQKKQEKYFEFIFQDIKRLERLISEVNDIATIQTGKFTLDQQIVPLNEFLEKVLNIYSFLYHKKFHFIGKLIETSSVLVSIDGDRIQQVLDNILDNANKNTDKDGKIKLNVSIDSKVVSIIITDDGAGIQPSDLDKIFEQFVSIPTSHAIPGPGIGLFISREICKAHGGSLSALSDGQNEGATFKIVIPRYFPVVNSNVN